MKTRIDYLRKRLALLGEAQKLAYHLAQRINPRFPIVFLNRHAGILPPA
jgi:hypothetical protein